MPLHGHPIGLASAALALLVSALWGGNLVALKLGLAVFPPFWSAFWRMLVGVAALAAYARYERISLRPRTGETWRLVVLSALFTAQISLLNTGTNLTSPAYGVVLLNSHPIFANLVGHFVAFEPKLDRLRLMALALAFGGVCLVAMGRPAPHLAPHPLAGNLLLVISAVLLGFRSIYTRGLVQSIEPTRALVWQVFVSIPAFFMMAMLFEVPRAEPVTGTAVGAIAYQGLVVAGFCFVAWTSLLRRHSAGTLSMFAFTVPFFGMALSALVFGEKLSARLLLGAAAVTTSIALVTLRGVRQSRSQAVEQEEAAERSV